MQSEDRHTRRYSRDDEVLVKRVPLAEERDVQEHDREELAALGEEEGDVVDVREGSVAERAGERACDGNEGEGHEDASGREDRWCGLALGSGCEKVDGAYDSGEDGLDGVEEDGIAPDFRAVDRAVGGRGELLLKVRPRQAVRGRQLWSAMVHQGGLKRLRNQLVCAKTTCWKRNELLTRKRRCPPQR